ncbi:MAG: TAXI family TRAP transporter solute-binding subunit [Betaproteobacteria bacterium]|nr:TAXI family TRAP transporter solute-binding subunit [Betaproteobacteria bacterium]
MPCRHSAARAAASEPTTVVLGTATPGGGFPIYGAAFAETVHETDPTVRIETRNTKGSTENLPLIEAGKLDIALVTGEPLHEAVEGIGRPKADVRILCAMYSTPGMFVTRGDSTARRIADLKGQSVAFGAKGSGLVILARYALDGLGLDLDRDFKAVYLEKAGDGPAMVEDGRVAALWGGGLGWPGFIAVSKSPRGARFIAPDAAETKRILAKHGLLKPMTVPAGTYAGQEAAVDSVGSWAFVIARSSLPEETAYRLARALHRGEAALGKRLPQARETTAANTVAAAPRVDLIHPGVQRYLREAALLR